DAAELLVVYESGMENMEISPVMKKLWAFIGRANKYIDETAPWALAKDAAKKAELATVMYNLAESLRVISVLISPFMPETAPKIWAQLGMTGDIWDVRLDAVKAWGGVPAGQHIGQAEPIFPRIEVEKEEQPAKQEKQKAAPKQEKKAEKAETNAEGVITIDEFKKTELRVAEVVTAERVPKTDKLMKLTLTLGDETREVVSGIADVYTAEELVGKHVILVANLKPAKLRGIVSHGMVLAASDGEKLRLIETDMPAGSVVR
ncbi:MAG: methionine--tRNA ligase subunit beta, partial [Schwartzia sp.]|nr:methionine--tRNA ligase subunit beta [Schwartzia sp. (in: firmicutes)]